MVTSPSDIDRTYTLTMTIGSISLTSHIVRNKADFATSSRDFYSYRQLGAVACISGNTRAFLYANSMSRSSVIMRFRIF